MSHAGAGTYGAASRAGPITRHWWASYKPWNVWPLHLGEPVGTADRLGRPPRAPREHVYVEQIGRSERDPMDFAKIYDYVIREAPAGEAPAGDAPAGVREQLTSSLARFASEGSTSVAGIGSSLIEAAFERTPPS